MEYTARNLAPIEPAAFDGDPVKYNKWLTSFNLVLERINVTNPVEKLLYLERYTTGEAQAAIEGFINACSNSSYDAAMAELKEQFGNPYLLANCFRQKLTDWQDIGDYDGPALRTFTRFLRSSRMAMENVHSRIMNFDCPFFMIEKVLVKLSHPLILEWSEKVIEHQQTHGDHKYPSFSDLCDFLKIKVMTWCNPTFSIPLASSKSDTTEDGNSDTNSDYSTECPYCSSDTHTLENCDSFRVLSISEQRGFISRKGLCFSCLNPGHVSRDCKAPLKCTICHKRHPSCLHLDKPYRRGRTPSTVETHSNGSMDSVSQPPDPQITQTETQSLSPNEQGLQQASKTANNFQFRKFIETTKQNLCQHSYLSNTNSYSLGYHIGLSSSYRPFGYFVGNHCRALAGSVTAGVHPAVGLIHGF